MPYMFQQPVREKFAPYVVHADILTPDECAKIVEIREKIQAQKAIVGNGDGALVEAIRRSEVRWMPWADEFDWIYRRIADAVLASNNAWYGFNLAGFLEPLQLTHYRATDLGHYDWHQDWGPGAMQARKLSTVLPLTDDHEGGEFEIYGLGALPEAKKGSMIIFPSFQLHRVKPVTKGDRWSLVSWITGPAFT